MKFLDNSGKSIKIKNREGEAKSQFKKVMKYINDFLQFSVNLFKICPTTGRIALIYLKLIPNR